MAREKIDDYMVAEWIQLHERGHSYRGIARKYNVNYRTVKARIQKAIGEYEKEHWEAVSQQVDAKYLDEHYRMLMQMASIVTDIISPNPMNTIQKEPSPVFLDMCLESATHKAAQFLVARGLDLTSEHRIDDSQATRLGHRLFDALMEHEPGLKTAIDMWECDWIEFQKARLELIGVAKNLFKQFKVANAVAEGIKKNIVDEALKNNLLSEEPCSSSIDTSNRDNERVQDKRGQGRPVRLIRYNKRIKTTVYRGSEEEVKAACEVYDKVLKQLCHEAYIVPVQESYTSLMRHVEEIKEYLDRLILVGRPQGQCSLCLNQLTRRPSSNRKVHPKEQ